MNVDDHLHIQIHDKVPVVTEPVYFRQPRNAQTTLTIQFIWCQHCQVLYSEKLLIPRATFHPKEIQRILHWVTISILHLGKTLLTTNIFLFLENLILRILSATGFCRGGVNIKDQYGNFICIWSTSNIRLHSIYYTINKLTPVPICSFRTFVVQKHWDVSLPCPCTDVSLIHHHKPSDVLRASSITLVDEEMSSDPRFVTKIRIINSWIAISTYSKTTNHES